MLITFLRNADRVKIACMAQLVNVIAPIMTGPGGAWRQTIYWPLYLASKYMRGTALRPLLASPCYESKTYGDTPMLDAAASLREDGSLAVYCVNRGEDDLELELDLRAFNPFTRAKRIELRHGDVNAVNTCLQPDVVAPHEIPCTPEKDGRLTLCIPARSLSVIELS